MEIDSNKKDMELVVNKIKIILKFSSQPNNHTEDNILKILIDSYQNRIMVTNNS